jgi:hypothetical protein
MAKKASTKKPAAVAPKFEKFSDDPALQARYDECREAGSSPKLAELLASKTATPYHNHFSPMHPRANKGRGY